MVKIHECTAECRHGPSRPNGFLVQRIGTREQHERDILTKAAGRRVDYLGELSPEHPAHVWRVGGKPFRLPERAERADEGKPSKAGAIYRSAVWAGNGRPGPVDFSRPAEPEKQPYPQPALTSVMEPIDHVPGPVMLLKGYAERLGWISLTPRQSIGYVPHSLHGTPSKAAKSLWCLKMMRGDQRAVAVRTDGSWSSLWTWSSEEFFARHATLEAFKEALR